MSNTKNDELQQSKDRSLFDKNPYHGGDKSGFFLTSRRVSWLFSAVILFSFFVFITGYFLGKHHAVEKFYHKIEQDSFADHIYYSMCSLYDKGGIENNNGGGTEAVATDSDGEDQEKGSGLELSMQGALTLVPASAIGKKVDSGDCTTITDKEGQKTEEKEQAQYYAELVGFGTETAAEKFADELKKKNITVLVKRRHSKTARGRVTTWYQVISETFSNKGDLMAFVDDVSTRERLKDVRIVSC